MFINQLKINSFRCYETVDLLFDERINIFFGENGAGKTSLLEAVYFLSTGKSFRSKKTKNLIHYTFSDLTVFATTLAAAQHPALQVGINLQKNLKKSIKLNHKKLRNQSAIAHRLPVVSIDPDSYLFIDKPPQFRRSFLDWLVFHVKPEYLNVWSNCSRCQKQLNTLYKNKNTEQLTHWEEQYIQYADQLNKLRKEAFNFLQRAVKDKIQEFIPELADMKLGYYQGWSKDNTLYSQLEKDREKNLLYGNLTFGVHKMDIKNTINQANAQDSLSRGQKKLISIIYYLCLIELITDQTSVHPILCLDDMDAELDVYKTKILCDFIQQAPNQVFISTVDKDKLLPMLENVALFHVKQDVDNKTVVEALVE